MNISINKIMREYIESKSKFPKISKNSMDGIITHNFLNYKNKNLPNCSSEVFFNVEKIIFNSKEVICFTYIIPTTKNKTNIYYSEQILNLTLEMEKKFNPLIEMYYENNIVDDDGTKYHILLVFKSL